MRWQFLWPAPKEPKRSKGDRPPCNPRRVSTRTPKTAEAVFGGVAVSAIISPLPRQKAPPRQGHTVTQLPFEYGNRLLCVFCSCFWLLENVSLQSSGYAGYGYQYVGVSSRQPFSVFENASVIVSLSPSSSLSTSTFTYSPFDGFTIFIVS